MNRVSFLADLQAKPIDLLTLRRNDLIDLVKSALNDFHQQRRALAGHPGHQDAIARCVYWDEVLGWLKDSVAEKVTLVKP